MARLLAVDWDRHEARYVVASSTGDGLVVRAASSVPLVDVAEGGNAPHPDIGGSLRAALADQSVGRAVALVGVERSAIELLHFTLPPASDDELPEMVANQAMRESQLVTEESILDFVPSDQSDSVPRDVTAAVLSADHFEQIMGACQTAGLKPKRLLLRPFAAASLFKRLVSAEERVCLLVNLIAEEVDLIFVAEGKVVFFRTVRLPKAAEDRRQLRRLLTEISRTLVVAAQGRLGDEKVESVYLFGNADEHEPLAAQIREQILLPVDTVDPFEAVEVPDGVAPAHAGRFASLLGMLYDEAEGVEQAIDFLHPRRPPQPLNRRRIVARVAGLLAAAVLAVTYFVWGQFSELDAEIVGRLRTLKSLDTTAKKAAKQQKVAASLRAWEAGNVIWLDELRDLSLRFPSGRDMVIQRMTMSSSNEGGGSIVLNGLVRDPAIVVRMEQGIRDQRHDISSKRVQERVREKSYTWHFETLMAIGKRNKSEYTSYLPDGQQRPQEPAPAKGDASAAAEQGPPPKTSQPADEP